MRWLFLLLLEACSFNDFSKSVPEEIHVDSHELTKTQKKLLVKINTKISVKNIRKNLFLVSSPTYEHIGLDKLKESEAFSLKKASDSQVELLSKKKLSGEYGLYWQQGENEAVLLYVLKIGFVKVEHDFKKKSVSNERSLFTFTFDEPVSFTDADVSLANISGGLSPAIESITVLKDQKTVMVRISKNSLKPGENYRFNFLPATKNQVSVKFLVQNEKIYGPTPFKIKALSHGAEFISADEHLASTELFLLENEEPTHYFYEPKGQLLIDGLMSGKKYDYIVRTQMTDQSFWQMRGSFSTAAF
jgi:hypothetical protein